MTSIKLCIFLFYKKCCTLKLDSQMLGKDVFFVLKKILTYSNPYNFILIYVKLKVLDKNLLGTGTT